MFFKLVHDQDNDIIPLDPDKLLESCEANGWDTEAWLGKANSVVGRRGINPSYAHFLISPTDAEYIRENVLFVDIIIETDELNDDGDDYVVITGKNFQVYGLESVTPSFEGKGSVYLLTLVDHRANIPGTDMSFEERNGHTINRDYINKVLSHNGTNFVYDHDSTLPYYDTTNKTVLDTKVTATTPLGWKDTIEAILMLNGGLYSNGQAYYPYNSTNLFSLETGEFGFPEEPPQDLYIGLHANIASVLYKLLFSINAGLTYDGQGGFSLIKIVDIHDNTMEGIGYNPFEQYMEFDEDMVYYTDGDDINYAALSDKKFDLVHKGQNDFLPEAIMACARWVPSESPGIFAREYKRKRIILFNNVTPKKNPGPGTRYVEIPHSWANASDATGNPLDRVKNLWEGKNSVLWSYPPKKLLIGKLINVTPGYLVERVSWFFTSKDSAGTWVENVAPIEWDWLLPEEAAFDGPDIITGRTTAAVESSDLVFKIKAINVVNGVDPRDNPYSPDEEVEIVNATQTELPIGTTVYAIKNATSYKWQLIAGGGDITVTPGGTTTGSSVVQFRLLENLNRSDYNAKAVLIDVYGRAVDKDGKPVLDPDKVPDWQGGVEVFDGDIRVATLGDPIGTPPAWDAGDFIKSISTNPRFTNDQFDSNEAQYWEATNLPNAHQVLVVNPDHKFYGYRAYTDYRYGDQWGYVGTAFKLPNKGISNNEDAGSTGNWDVTGIVEWEPNHAYLDNDIVLVPDLEGNNAGSYRTGDPIYSRKARTSREEFDWKEAQFWLRVKDPTDLPSASSGDGTGTTGTPTMDQYQIIEMEAEARWVEGTTISKSTQYITDSTEFLPRAELAHWECYMEIDTFWGAAPNNRPPKSVIVYSDMYTSTEEVKITDSIRKPTPDPGTERTEIGIGVRVILRLNELGVGSGIPCRALYDDLARCYVLDKVGTVRPVILVGSRYFNADGTPDENYASRDILPRSTWDSSDEHLSITRQNTKKDYNAYELVGDLRAGKEDGYTVGNKIWVDSFLTVPLTVPNGKGIIGFVVNNTLVGVDPYEIEFPKNDQVTEEEV